MCIGSNDIGVPIVCTPTDGLMDLVQNDITGSLLDDDGELAESALAIISDDNKHKVISDAARQRVSDLMNFSELKSEIEQQ